MIARSSSRHIASQRRYITRQQRRTLAFYTLIAPWLLGFVVLGVIPLVLGFLTSLTNYDGLNLDTIKFVGLRNYERMWGDRELLAAFGRTLIWSALNVPIWLICSLGLALVVNSARHGRSFFRTTLYLPSVVPIVAVAWVWKLFLDRNVGLLNGMISAVVPGVALPWLTDYALTSLTAVSLWTGLGSGMVVFLAGLQGIPHELEEAARIDGATSSQTLRHITIPLLTPVIFFQLVLALINSFQTLVLPMLLGENGKVPPRGAYMYMYHTYSQIFTQQRFGYGTALLWVLFVVVLILTLIVFRTSRYWVYNQNTDGSRS